jgi:hypothetical protein
MIAPVVFDVDGTLTSEWYDEGNLLHLKENPIMLLLAISLQDKHPLLISTARPEYLRPQTEAWLAKHGLVPDRIYMRPNDREGIPDPQIKEKHLEEIVGEFGKPLIWSDDNRGNCDMLESHGIPVIHVKQ